MKKISFLIFTILFTVFGTGTTFAGTIDLPQTGQTTCYDESGTVITCSGTVPGWGYSGRCCLAFSEVYG